MSYNKDVGICIRCTARTWCPLWKELSSEGTVLECPDYKKDFGGESDERDKV